MKFVLISAIVVAAAAFPAELSGEAALAQPAPVPNSLAHDHLPVDIPLVKSDDMESTEHRHRYYGGGYGVYGRPYGVYVGYGGNGGYPYYGAGYGYG